MDTLAPESTRQNLRSQRLNLLTNEPHQRLESLVKSKEPFASRDNFARFVAAQYLFQHDLSCFIATKRWPACSPAWLPAPATTPLVQTWRTSAIRCRRATRACARPT